MTSATPPWMCSPRTPPGYLVRTNIPRPPTSRWPQPSSSLAPPGMGLAQELCRWQRPNLLTSSPSPLKTYINFRKDNWTQLEDDTGQEFSTFPSPETSKILRRFLLVLQRRTQPAEWRASSPKPRPTFSRRKTGPDNPTWCPWDFSSSYQKKHWQSK